MVEPPRVATDEPVVRLATTDDVPVMVTVLSAAFDQWPAFAIDVPAVDHLRWKMSAPDVPAAHTVVEVDGATAAVSVRWVFRIQLGDEELVQDSGIDQSVLPSMQGRGLGGAMARFAHGHAVEYSDVSLGTGSKDPRIPNIFERFDPVAVSHPMTIWSRTSGPRALVATHLRGGGPLHLVRSVARLVAHQLRRRLPPSGARIEVVAQFDDRAEALWVKYSAGVDFAVVRSVAYLNWRYCDPRGGTARVLGAFAGDQLLGFAMFKRSGAGANLLDLVVDPDRPAVGPELLEAGVRAMQADGARSVVCWLNAGNALESALRASGFLKTGTSTEFTCGPPRRGRTSALLERMYAGDVTKHLVGGDSDLFKRGAGIPRSPAPKDRTERARAHSSNVATSGRWGRAGSVRWRCLEHDARGPDEGVTE